MDQDPAAYNRRENDKRLRLLQALNVCFSRMYHQVNVRKPCRLPASGPAILVCNHTSGLDPLLIQSACPRIIRWMMAKEYYNFRPLRFVFDSVGIILVERSGRDMAATRAAMRALENGYVLGVFPEGRIETTRDLLPFQAGIGLLAMKTGAPVYPAYLDGTQRQKEMVEAFLLPNSASLAFGGQVQLPTAASPRDAIEQSTRCIQQAVEALKSASPSRLRCGRMIEPGEF